MKRKKQSKEEKAPKKERKEKDYKLIKKSIESFLCICHSVPEDRVQTHEKIWRRNVALRCR